MDFLELSLRCTAEHVAEVEKELNRSSAIAITIRNGDRSNPSTTINADWTVTQITALFPKETKMREIEDVLSNMGCQEFKTRVLEESAWTQGLIQPTPELNVGPFVIGDPLSNANSTQLPLEISAGLAFGTGAHDTTSLCLEWLAELDLSGKHVLDLGCGTGILAIAAMKLGALSATAIDNDPVALTVTFENAAKNEVELSISNRLDLKSRFDVVVCNIYADTLIEYAEKVEHVLKSHALLALSGIIKNQYERVKQSYAHVQFDPIHERNDWVLLSGTKRSSKKIIQIAFT